MIPSVVATQLRTTVEAYLATTFNLKDRAYEAALFEFLRDPDNGLFRGPYLDLRLPFRKATDLEPVLRVRPDYTPYQHQHIAWQRLTSLEQTPRSTLVATGTGSGKTECFMFPLLDHCLRERSQGNLGIKAIILYPMNALASDQALRFAEEIHEWEEQGKPGLRGKVTAGIYVGGEGTNRRMGPKELIDIKEKLRKEPPDILLTNYRMLDFLLMRPVDRALWRNNGRKTLQYLVLDEMHTYDGAQGTDVAFLIRRLKQRLGIPKRHLCCVGTSATIGGEAEAGRAALLQFASDVFGEAFEPDAVITEDRLSVGEAFPGEPDELQSEAWDASAADLDAAHYPERIAYLERQAALWLGPPRGDAEAWIRGDEDAPLQLGDALATHPFLRDLLHAFGRSSVTPALWADVLSRMPADLDFRLDEDRDRAWLLLSSFLSLLAIARRKDGERTVPFLTLQVQLWMRELRRLLRRLPRTLDEPPAFAWWDESPEPPGSLERYATQVYCRDCGALGLGALKLEGQHDLVTDPARVGRGYLEDASTARFLQIGHLGPDAQQSIHPDYLCPATLYLGPETKPRVDVPDAHGEMHPLPVVPVTVYGPEPGERFKRQCPICQADDGLTILGARAASLTSVAISHLFTSPYNDDRKLLAFTDSVQDASHRAAFFGGRTFRFTLRTAILAAARERPQSLAELARGILDYWRQRLHEDEQPGRAAAMLLPPDLREDPAYTAFWDRISAGKKPTKPERRALDGLLETRLGWEVVREFGLGVVIGRSLDRTGSATAAPDLEAIQRAAEAFWRWNEEQRVLQTAGERLTREEVEHFLLGLVERLRTRGGVFHPLLAGYVKNGSRYFLSRRKAPRLSRFGPRSVLPRFGYFGAMHAVFEPLCVPARRRTWYRDWVARSLRTTAQADGVVPVLERAFELLELEGLVRYAETKRRARDRGHVVGLEPAALTVVTTTASVHCSECGTARTVPVEHAPRWHGRRCTTYRCAGAWAEVEQDSDPSVTRAYYRTLYGSGQAHRIFAREHTGLLERGPREALERDFKAGALPDAPNLLACTPTLEMGIDIGDLSAVMLCSVPPLPANFIQRVGRAGRSTGNALVLTVANARPHDRYFFETPSAMMSGKVEPPACFLDAPDMLKRQLVAHALDFWAKTADEGRMPRNMRQLLGPANAEGFPNDFYEFYEREKYAVAAEFFAAFDRDSKKHPAWSSARAVLRKLVDADFVPRSIRDAFATFDEERTALRKRRKDVSDRRAKILADPSLAVSNEDDPEHALEEELRDLEQAERGYKAMLTAMDMKYPPNVLTDAGVLPNYAFPEPGVTLRATFFGARGSDDGGKRTRPAKSDFQRPASAALREFAPFNSFYADGKRVPINQLDLGSRKNPATERWRFCPHCHHCALDEVGAEVPPVCPQCRRRGWNDTSAIRQMIQFRRAWSSTTLSEASTTDETDERKRESYATLELIERDPSDDATGAKLIDRPEDGLLFGYELWGRAQLREVNFGKRFQHDGEFKIAGERIGQAGFLVCRDCGRVQDTSQSHEHTPWCRTRTSGVEETFVPVSLYRELTSEAIRILLPVAEHEVHEIVASMRAAFELGFRRKFGGQASHLKITTMSEPAGDGRRRFLVIYDTVPGGTGYLAELWRDGQLFDVMERSLRAMRECRCVRDEDRDGCYQCLFAHQHQQELSSISRRRASTLFAAILGAREHVKEEVSLGEVNNASLLESELERRFVAALRRASEARGWAMEETIYKGATAWRLRLPGDEVWELRPQVHLGPKQGVAVSCKPDFILVPLKRPDVRGVAVFTDGFQYHAQPEATHARIEDDILKRCAILEASPAFEGDRYITWSLTYDDVIHALEAENAGPLEKKLLGVDNTRVFKRFDDKTGDPDQPGDASLMRMESFELLLRWLERPDFVWWDRVVVTALASSMDLRHPSGPAVQAAFHRWESELQCSVAEALELDEGKTWLHFVRSRASVGVGAVLSVESMGGFIGKVKAYLRLHDTLEHRGAEAFKEDWRAFWQAFNLLQFHYDNVEVTSDERLRAHALATPARPVKEERVSETSPAVELPGAYATIASAYEEARALWTALSEVEIDPPREANVCKGVPSTLEVDLAWPEARVALCFGADEYDVANASKLGWVLFDLETVEFESVRDALRKGSGA